MIAAVHGTEGDPQRLGVQEAKLRDAGVLVYPSNTAAANAAAGMLRALEGRESRV